MSNSMRFPFFNALIGIGLLAACSLAEPTGGQDAPASPASPILGDAIAVTTLDAEKDGQVPVETGAAIDSGPVVADNPAAAPATPAPIPRSELEIACVKKGGSWVTAGKSGAKTCVRVTRDSGKQCSRQSQCEGLCLARSGSCAPIMPLFGCNEIFQDNGQRVTLCID